MGDIGHAIRPTPRAERCSVCAISRPRVGTPSTSRRTAPLRTVGEGQEIRPGMISPVEPMINLGRPHVKLLSDGWPPSPAPLALGAVRAHGRDHRDQHRIFTLSPTGRTWLPWKDSWTRWRERHALGWLSSRMPPDRRTSMAMVTGFAPASAISAPRRFAGYELLRWRSSTPPARRHQAARQGAAEAFRNFERSACGPARAAEGGRGRRRPRGGRAEADPRLRRAHRRRGAPEAPCPLVVVGAHRLLPHRHGLRGARTVPYPLPRRGCR